MAEFEFKAGVLTVSDKGAKGEREDRSGKVVEEMLGLIKGTVTHYLVVPDEIDRIRDTLIAWSDLHRLDLIVTTGGTGFAPRDLTPEATAAAVERLAPGLSEAMRAAGMDKTPHAMLSRGISGLRGKTLIVNLPGSEKGVRESLEAVIPALPHAIETLTGRGGECGG